MKISVLISTLDRGIGQVGHVLHKKRDDVEYVILQQYTKEEFNSLPGELKRGDVSVYHVPGKGVAKSRNMLIHAARGDIGLFSDDDVVYPEGGLDTVLRTFSKDPELDVAIFKIKTLPGQQEYKNYPDESFRLRSIPFSIGTIEIGFRIDRIRKNSILFDERFGLGNPLLIGSEENLFILDCLKAGLKVVFFPEYIVQHPYESTVRKMAKYDRRRVSVTGAYDSRVNGWVSIPKSFLGTVKYFPDLIRHRKNPFLYLKERLSAAVYIRFSRPTGSGKYGLKS